MIQPVGNRHRKCFLGWTTAVKLEHTWESRRSQSCLGPLRHCTLRRVRLSDLLTHHREILSSLDLRMLCKASCKLLGRPRPGVVTPLSRISLAMSPTRCPSKLVERCADLCRIMTSSLISISSCFLSTLGISLGKSNRATLSCARPITSWRLTLRPLACSSAGVLVHLSSVRKSRYQAILYYSLNSLF